MAQETITTNAAGATQPETPTALVGKVAEHIVERIRNDAKEQPCFEQWQLMSANVRAEYLAAGFFDPSTTPVAAPLPRKFRFPGSMNTVHQSGFPLSEFSEGVNVEIIYDKDGEKLPSCAEVYSDNQQEYVAMGLEWDGEELTGYDGSFELPREVVLALLWLGNKIDIGILEDAGLAPKAPFPALLALAQNVIALEMSDISHSPIIQRMITMANAALTGEPAPVVPVPEPLTKAAQTVELLAQDLREAHSQACGNNPILAILLLELLGQTMHIKQRLDHVVSVLLASEARAAISKAGGAK